MSHLARWNLDPEGFVGYLEAFRYGMPPHGGFGMGALVRFFAPDMARALNLWVPPGISEGSAIQVESLRGVRAGRLNYGYHAMQYRAAAGDGKPWSLAETLEAPVYTRPIDRF